MSPRSFPRRQLTGEIPAELLTYAEVCQFVDGFPTDDLSEVRDLYFRRTMALDPDDDTEQRRHNWLLFCLLKRLLQATVDPEALI